MRTATIAFSCFSVIMDSAMLLTLTTTHSPATDLGHLLRKNPARLAAFELVMFECVRFLPVGPGDSAVGSPTQTWVFERNE